jgi:hypothetical protein
MGVCVFLAASLSVCGSGFGISNQPRTMASVLQQIKPLPPALVAVARCDAPRLVAKRRSHAPGRGEKETPERRTRPLEP